MKQAFLIILLLTLPYFMEKGSAARDGLKEGQDAPNISLPTPSGDTINLSSYKGKIVLVDFWASWCHPCREVSSKMVDLYNKFKDRHFENGDGFEILSVSLDDKPEDWKRAIQEDNLPWKGQVSEMKRWRSDAVKDYFVTFVPNGTLIDGNGKVIAGNLDYRMVSFYLKGMAKRH